MEYLLFLILKFSLINKDFLTRNGYSVYESRSWHVYKANIHLSEHGERKQSDPSGVRLWDDVATGERKFFWSLQS